MVERIEKGTDLEEKRKGEGLGKQTEFSRGRGAESHEGRGMRVRPSGRRPCKKGG